MNILNILQDIEQTDPEVYGRLDSRRSAMRQFSNLGKKLTVGGMALGLGTMFKKAYGQVTPASVISVLNFALLLEYLEAEFYRLALANVPFPNATAKQTFVIIEDHEQKHVKFLRAAISGAGGTPINSPKFDFSGAMGAGNGPFRAAFSNYPLFLAVSQTLEDTGVRAYKGQAPNLIGTGDVLEAALNIHSVEARHASKVRLMRRMMASSLRIKPWIVGMDSGIEGGAGGLVVANYAGEITTNQGGVEIFKIHPNVTFDIATESFDEPLSRGDVENLVKGFIVPGT
ncbi:MAG: ferritin-like domain-containing protein [Cytophagaceae bacterium]|nr:ferritin-like domain-containing protein [Cytophagaceae bacterium]